MAQLHMARGRHEESGEWPIQPDGGGLTPSGLRATRFAAGADELVVFSFPLKSPILPEGLSKAEREVTLALLEGLSNAAIAARRGSAVRTVANQVASIFRKLGVSSRAELHAALTEAPSRERLDAE